MSDYFKNIKQSIATVKEGMKLTVQHLADARVQRKPVGVAEENYFEWDKGIATLQYPAESLPVPDNGRYRLHNEIDDCIVCDKCAKVCPVNCIDIEPVRSAEEIGKTSDGTSKRIYAAKFDIDMAKCCFCGLCTTVCPTECLTMTKVYDFSEFEVEDHNYVFAEMTPLEILEKKKAFEEYQAAKEAAKVRKVPASKKPTIPKPKPVGAPAAEGTTAKKPVFKPRVPLVKKPAASNSGEQEAGAAPKKPLFRPKVKPVVKKNETASEEVKSSALKPVIKSKVKPVIKKAEDQPASESPKAASPKPVIKPKVKPVMKKPVVRPMIKKAEYPAATEEKKAAPKPVIKPNIKPVMKKPVVKPLIKKKDDGPKDQPDQPEATE